MLPLSFCVESGRALHPAGSGGRPHLPEGGVPQDSGLQGLQVTHFLFVLALPYLIS